MENEIKLSRIPLFTSSSYEILNTANDIEDAIFDIWKRFDINKAREIYSNSCENAIISIVSKRILFNYGRFLFFIQDNKCVVTRMLPRKKTNTYFELMIKQRNIKWLICNGEEIGSGEV